MEDKANRMLDSAMAEAELSADMDAENDLVNKYVSGESSSTVDDELAHDESKTWSVICRTCRNVSGRFFFVENRIYFNKQINKESPTSKCKQG
ncbi:MAG: PspA/IM30 family protein [Lachnospiraceae bacterium]